MNIFEFSYNQFLLFILVLIRISSVFALVPIFGSRNIPVQLKISLSLIISIIIFSVIKPKYVVLDSLSSLVWASAMEVVIGIVIGYASRLMFTGVQIAGQLIGFQMGFAIVNIFDPATNSQVSIISEMKYIFAILIFLSINGHHFIIRGVVESFELIPLGGVYVGTSVIKILIGLFGNLFSIAVKIGAPIVTAVFFINVGLGLIARTVPQMNVFIVGFPLQIGIGMIILAVSMPIFFSLMVKIFNQFEKDVFLLLRAM